ncbi:MAG: DUF2461 domain-containing protein [Cyclobacteriaceae bacterium]
MPTSKTLKPAFDFLKRLKKNNNREWFNDHKDQYLLAHQNVIDFADDLLAKMAKHDLIETQSGKKSLFRIYRDTRFSKDKTPYKSNWAGGFKRATKKLRGGYYFHIQPGNSMIAGGFWNPNSQDIKHIREQIAQDDVPLRKVLRSKKFKDYFGELQGEQVKTAPKGFDKDHSSIDLLRYKQLILVHNFKDSEVLQKDFSAKVAQGFKNMRPFMDCMSEILTTDLNGVSLA